MLTIQASVLSEYKNFVAGAIDALLPLFGVIVGIFLAFAIANSARFLIMRMVKK